MKLFMRYQTLCEALKMNELRRTGKYNFHFFTSHQPMPLSEIMWCTKNLKTVASVCSLSAATATPFVLLGSGVIAIFGFFETGVER